MAVALLVAAGRGERLGSSGPKAFVALAGRPMLEWSAQALLGVAAIERVVVALPVGAQPPAGCVGVAGGRSRSHSVRNALAAAGDGDPVLVHDAARPLVDAALIEAVLGALDDPAADAAIAAAPVADTIKEADEAGWVTRTLERRRLWVVQTPQAFRRAPLECALSDEGALEAATDDAWLIERQGGRVRVVPAPAGNLKVTTEVDLSVAAARLAGAC